MPGELTHRGVSGCGIHMGHLLLMIPWCPVQAVPHLIGLGDVAPTAGAALGAKQLFEPFVAQHQYGVGIEN